MVPLELLTPGMMGLCWGGSWVQSSSVIFTVAAPTHSPGTELASTPCAGAVAVQWLLPMAEEPL